jgi:hypothetical protein
MRGAVCGLFIAVFLPARFDGKLGEGHSFFAIQSGHADNAAAVGAFEAQQARRFAQSLVGCFGHGAHGTTAPSNGSWNYLTRGGAPTSMAKLLILLQKQFVFVN